MQDINIYHLLRFFATKWLTIAIITSICFLSGFIYSFFIQVPLYKSDATLLIVRSNTENQDVALINNYVELFKSRRVLEPVIADQKIDMSYDQLVEYIGATSEKNTDVIKVSISTDSPEKSKVFIEKAVISFKKNVTSLYTSDNVQIVDDASLATEPYNVDKFMILSMTTFAGFAISILSLFFIFDYRQNKDSLPIAVGQTKELTDAPSKITEDVAATEPVLTDEKPSQLSQNLVIQNHVGMNYANRSEWIRSMYSRERQPRR